MIQLLLGFVNKETLKLEIIFSSQAKLLERKQLLILFYMKR